MRTAIYNGRIFTEDAVINDAVIITEQDIIIDILDVVPEGMKCIDLHGQNIAPGFIDIQLNGGEQHYFSQHPVEATLHDMSRASLQYGTTHILPCLVSSTQDNILKAIETVRNYMHRHAGPVMGMHLEGPFINPEKRGAHVAAYVRKPTNAELGEIIKYGSDVIKLITIAPECFTPDQLLMLMESGITVSAGHSNINYEKACDCFGKGISMVTHLYNAMTQMEHRAPGLVGAAFTNDQVYTPIILDGAHCDYAAAKIAYKIKQDKLFLISDAAFLGRKVQSFEWGAFDATLQDGFYRNKEGKLAGAAVSMVEAVQNAIKYVNIPLPEAISMATIRPAKAIGMDAQIGRIAKGYQAKFVVFDDALANVKTFEA